MLPKYKQLQGSPGKLRLLPHLGLQRAWGTPEKGPTFCCISKAHLILKFCSLKGKAVPSACSHSRVTWPAPVINRPSVQSFNFLTAAWEGWSLSCHPFLADTHRMAPGSLPAPRAAETSWRHTGRGPESVSPTTRCDFRPVPLWPFPHL